MKKLRVGTVGFGPRGRSMTRLAAEFDNVKIVAGCDIRTAVEFRRQRAESNAGQQKQDSVDSQPDPLGTAAAK